MRAKVENGSKRREWVQKNRKGSKRIGRETKKRMGVIEENLSKEENRGKRRERGAKEENEGKRVEWSQKFWHSLTTDKRMDKRHFLILWPDKPTDRHIDRHRPQNGKFWRCALKRSSTSKFFLPVSRGKF